MLCGSINKEAIFQVVCDDSVELSLWLSLWFGVGTLAESNIFCCQIFNFDWVGFGEDRVRGGTAGASPQTDERN